ncbi:MAG: hypothetical protein AAF722_05055 [Cyanobacteria bacterium P01_C01_bin.70]
MSAFSVLFQRFNKTVLTITIALITLIAVFVPSALAQRPPSPYLYTSSEWVSIGANQSGTLVWRCPSDRYTVGGGFETEAISGNSAEGFKMIHSYPEDYRTWRLRFRNTDDAARNVKIYNICALP